MPNEWTMNQNNQIQRKIKHKYSIIFRTFFIKKSHTIYELYMSTESRSLMKEAREKQSYWRKVSLSPHEYRRGGMKDNGRETCNTDQSKTCANISGQYANVNFRFTDRIFGIIWIEHCCCDQQANLQLCLPNINQLQPKLIFKINLLVEKSRIHFRKIKSCILERKCRHFFENIIKKNQVVNAYNFQELPPLLVNCHFLIKYIYVIGMHIHECLDEMHFQYIWCYKFFS